LDNHEIAMNATAQLGRREQLAHFLRAKRQSVRPQQLGLAVRRLRRATGLLREEVAELAGVSLTWYTWMEQARPTNPSARVLDGLASALQLMPAERQHLFKLARPDLEADGLAADAEAVWGSAHGNFLHSLAPHPAYAIDVLWNVLEWNAPAGKVFGEFAAAGVERNVLYRLLFDAHWRALFVDWEKIIALAVAQFRASTAHIADQIRFGEFVATLSGRSALFAQLWSLQAVALPPACVKELRHPLVGALRFNYTTLRPEGLTGEARFTIYTPTDAQSAQGLRRLGID
jgi:transcriptional regulator with XRE-family HTH domain